MPYTAVEAQVIVVYRCSFCGHTGEAKVDGEELIDNSFTVFDFECPECGHTLTQCSYGDDIDSTEDDGYEEDEDEGENKDDK